ncbi:MAG: hypothetical protein WA133_06855 [Syntrophales bacterium]
MTGWFYDDIKDIIEICRVAAYLNQTLKPTAGTFGGFHQSHRRGGLLLR